VKYDFDIFLNTMAQNKTASIQQIIDTRRNIEELLVNLIMSLRRASPAVSLSVVLI
jgi:hypothetical protein